MANIIDISEDQNQDRLINILRKSLQSCNLNFIIGSGCSYPAIKPLGNVEREIYDLLQEGKELEAEKIKYLFLKPIAKSSNILSGSDYDEKTTETLNNHHEFIHNILHLLTNRKNTILLKQANVFTTNYDFFFKKASENFGSAVKLNDGFNRNPKLNSQYHFSTSEFFTTVYNKGNLYNYQVEIPTINLIKLHGSMSWEKVDANVVFKIEDKLKMLRDRFTDLWGADKDVFLSCLKEFNDQFYIVLPVKDKFRDTLLNRLYYDLLRIYSNELDKENTLLISEGFSFEDEHILDITQRALRNPTLRLVIFSFRQDDVQRYQDKFSHNNNVDIVFRNDMINFKDFNGVICDILPQKQNVRNGTNDTLQEEQSDD